MNQLSFLLFSEITTSKFSRIPERTPNFIGVCLFKNVVAAVPSQGTIIYPGGPSKQSHHNPGLDTKYADILWTCRLRKIRVLINLCANIADSCIPFQIVGKRYAKKFVFVFFYSIDGRSL